MNESNTRDLLAPHPLVAAGAGGGIRRLTGFVGEASDADTVRIFCDLSLNEYWDVSRADIVSVSEVAGTDGCIAVLVPSAARLQHTRVVAANEESSSGLRGDLLRRALVRTPSLASRGFGRLGIAWTITVTIVTILSDDQGNDFSSI